jgi:hypothetical protein
VISIETARNELQHPYKTSAGELLVEAVVLIAIATIMMNLLFEVPALS